MTQSAVPREGSAAPDFTLLTDEGKPLTLSSLRGRPVVLFFYPKNNTPACTVEACKLSNAFPDIETSNAIVLGISPDSVESHKRFRSLFSLSYNLLADTEHKVAALYGAWGERSLFGRDYMGILRSTFIVDSHGIVARVFENVRVMRHAAEVKEALKGIK